MMQTLCFQIGLMRFLGRVKPTNQCVDTVCANPRAPSLAAFEFGNAQKPSRFVSGVRTFLVLNVARSRNITKIAKCVIARVAVNVVNIIIRPCAGHVKPSKPTSAVTSFIDPHNCVSFGFGVPSNRPRNNFAARFYAPGKDTCFGIVVQQCTQLVKCDVKMAHAISLS